MSNLIVSPAAAPPGPSGPFPGPSLTGTSESGPGVLGESNFGPGVYGQSVGPPRGFVGVADDGVLGEGKNGVHGRAPGAGTGVWGENTGNGYGVKGSTKSAHTEGANGTAGVWGDNAGTGTGVKGTSVGGDAVLGFSTAADHAGVAAVNDSGGFGVWARGTPAGHFEGDAGAVGVEAHGGSQSAGVLGIGGGPNGPGVTGIGAGGSDTAIPSPVGVYGVGGEAQPGVVGLGGPSDGESGPGVVGIGGLIGGTGGDPNRGPSGYGPNDRRVLNSMGVYGRGAVNTVGIYGEGGERQGAGVIGVGAGVLFNLNRSLQNDIPQRAGVYGQGGDDLDGPVPDTGNGAPGVVGQGGLEGPGILGIGGLASENFSFAPAGVFEGGDVDILYGNLNVTGGAKSAVVPFPDGTQRRLYCMESPECWFEDFGTAQLGDGHAQVQLDPGFASVVAADDYHVFLTEYEDHNGLYVTGRTSAGFAVRAKTSPNASGTFSYRIVAKRKDIAAPRFEEVVLPRRRTADRSARRAAAASPAASPRPTP
jgi:hypothetical protein